MKVLTFGLIASLLILSYAGEADCGKHRCYSVGKHFNILESDDVEVDFKDGSIIFTYDNEYIETVEITEDHDLFVNDEYIKTDQEQDELLEEYYDRMMDVVDFAKEIGWEGAKVGASGARVGLKAFCSIFKLLLVSYDRDDLERDIERETDKLEARARKLERMAERIEDMVDELDDTHGRLRRAIPELRDLYWF